MLSPFFSYLTTSLEKKIQIFGSNNQERFKFYKSRKTLAISMFREPTKFPQNKVNC